MEDEFENPKKSFKLLKDKVSSATLEAVKRMGFGIMTDIQAEVLPEALDGADVVATAKTGSGKTLAFLIPVIETVLNCKERQIDGTCMIISPTRELAIQTYSVLQDLVAYHSNITSALIIGGENRKKQSVELATGVHIVVATPGRIFDHMRSKEFDYRNVCCLVLDEADKIFQYGFEEDLKQIINRLPKNRQTMLFSATQSERTEALIKSAMKDKVHNINTDEDNLMATVEGLKQGYAVCETEYRLWWLHKLLKKTRNYKIMVFFSSCKSVEFHYEFFSKYCQASVLCIHGKMSQSDRTDVISNFYNAEKIALFCTDLAARGLDIPAVDWIVQFDPPADANTNFESYKVMTHYLLPIHPGFSRIAEHLNLRNLNLPYELLHPLMKTFEEYIHRVGRTARGMGAKGNAVILLRPDEIEFVTYLKESKIYLDKYESWDKFNNLQPKLDTAMLDAEFHQLAVEAFEGYMRAFEVKKLKHIFNLITMDVDSVARSFGLKERPDVDVRIGFSKKHRPRKRMAAILAEQFTGNTKRVK